MQLRKIGVLAFLTLWLGATLACSAVNNLFPDPASMESTAAAALTEEGHANPDATAAPDAGPTLKPGKKTPTPAAEVTLQVTVDIPDIPGFTSEAVPTDIPLVEEKPVNLFATQEVVGYQTEIDFDKVLAFYKAQMPENGWELTDTIANSSSAILNYTKADRLAFVTLAADNGLTSVSIVIQTK